MKKQYLIVIGIVILISLISIFISLKMLEPQIVEQKVNLENSQINIIDGEDLFSMTLDDFESIGVESFEAVLDTSTTDASTHDYEGVQLKDIFSHYNIDLNNKDTIVLTGADGYSVAYSIDEVIEDENVYIAYKEDDVTIDYQSIVTEDTFSNRRCKWLTRIEVK